MPDKPRHAVYFAPHACSLLHRLVAPLLGRDALAGRNVPQTAPPGLASAVWAKLARQPAHYGLHATLKAPFELKPGLVAADLSRALAELATDLGAVRLQGLRLARLGGPGRGFLALVPEPSAGANLLAQTLVERLDWLRGPLSAFDIQRRSGLSGRLKSQFLAWGYPYVFDDFVCHFSLTGRCPSEALLAEAGRALEQALRPVLGLDLMLDALSVFSQPDRQSPFAETARFALV
ncbi:MAG: DUF1045 domain-containing protein [Desulfovibrio sp.]|nr:DUF1045 domain-containing protein [Desulfovibrio sp.]